jgi:hypothetical protein
MNPYCAKCNAPRKDLIAILFRCAGCRVSSSKPVPTKYVPVKTGDSK